MAPSDLKMRPGAVVVFEGLDRTGKTTQSARLRSQLLGGAAVFAHMPTGSSEYGRLMYEIMQSRDRGPRSDISRQLAHLSCHAEEIPALVRGLSHRALVLDRFWWSTMAYGNLMPGNEDSAVKVALASLVELIWSPIVPSVIFTFMEPHQADRRNNIGVRATYERLVTAYPGSAVRVPKMNEGEVSDFILSELFRRELIYSQIGSHDA